MNYLLKNQQIKVLTNSRLIDYMTRRPTHFVTRMALQNQVENLCSASFRKRFTPGVVKENGWKTRCFYMWPLNRFGQVQRHNQTGFSRFLKKNIKENDIVWAYEPFSIEFYKKFNRKMLIYEMCDDTSAYFKNDPRKHDDVLVKEEIICRSADLVVTISDFLWQKKKHLNDNFHVVRNGADFEYFNLAIGSKRMNNEELGNVKGPIVGYHGAVSPWLDFDLIGGLAERLKGINLIFIGRINDSCRTEMEKLSKWRNVKFLGEKKYSELVDYIKYFNVTIIPFKIDQLIVSVNPIKMYEYLAAGKSVVSTPLPEVKLYEEEGIVETCSADSVNEFAQKIENLLETTKKPELVERRLQLAKENSWDARYQQLEKLAFDTLKVKGKS